MCSVLSNHHAPSHDIAETLGELECFKHIISGGWWITDAGEVTRAGDGVRNTFLSRPDVQRRLGWVQKPPLDPGKKISSRPFDHFEVLIGHKMIQVP